MPNRLRHRRRLAAPALALGLAFATIGAAPAQETMDLQTATAEEGFALAVELARKSVTTTQPDRDVLTELRSAYARDPALLIQTSGVVAEFFATVAAANDYWREE
jgi:hypothetical protein